MTEPEYKKLVLAYYLELLKAGDLAPELMSPKPGGIKAMVSKTLGERFDIKDEKTLRSFVGQRANVGEYHTVVQITSADLYKPLVKVLKERSVNTGLKNMDLLAWLIDYYPRPYRPDLIPPIKSAPSKIEQKSLVLLNGIQETPEHPERTNRKKILIGSVLSVLLLAGLGYWLYENHIGSYGCMIWRNDRYEPVDCHDNSLHTKPPQIDRQTMAHFRKITRPDTLTLYSVKKVFYAKYNGWVEFYTAPGTHPVDSNRRLLPMSAYILNKYVYHRSN